MVCNALEAAGASDALLVGGFVRDKLMGLESRDVDIEVYGLSYADIIEALKPLGRIDVVGTAFGVVKLSGSIDVSIPRRESKAGIGHCGFDVVPDSSLTPREAASRRDFTVNAIAMRINGEIVDPFNGASDIKKRILRAPSEAFGEDPLRVLRGMAFAARFDFEVEPRTLEMCRSLVGEFHTLSVERIWEEWRKWAVKSKKPSRGLKFLRSVNWLQCFPPLEKMWETEQSADHHPEGNLFLHTCHTLDAAAEVVRREGLGHDERIILIFSALTHDFGKITRSVQLPDGKISSKGHPAESVKLLEPFLAALSTPKKYVEKIAPLVRWHGFHRRIPESDAPPREVVRRLAFDLRPANVRLWEMLVESDNSGRPPLPTYDPATRWGEIARDEGVFLAPAVPFLGGSDLIDAGMRPSPDFRKILDAAYDAQLDGEIMDQASALLWLERRISEQGPC